MADLGIGLAGGAIGSGLTLIASFVVRMSSVPGEVSRNDRLCRERDEDLESWMCDENEALKWRLHARRGEMAASGILQSGEYAFRIRQEKDQSLHRYRDEVRRAGRDVALVYDHEGWLHSVWRRWKGRARHDLVTPAAAAEVIAAWQMAPEFTHATQPHVSIIDPTQRTLAITVQDVRARPGMFI